MYTHIHHINDKLAICYIGSMPKIVKMAILTHVTKNQLVINMVNMGVY